MMEEILIVDGYNCIHLWPHLNELKDESLEEARNRLIDDLIDYQASRGIRLILVFDAHLKTGPGSHEVRGNVEIIYTDHNETADRRIERLARSLVAPGRLIYVATSDNTEQRVTFGQGALRISARELYREVQEMREQVRKQIAAGRRRPSPLGQRLSKEVEEQLERWRRGKGPSDAAERTGK